MCYRYFIIRERKIWDAYIEGAVFYEIYHTWYYHSLNKEGEPLLFVYEEDGFYIALPLIKREIANSSYFDMTSVYGYTGPVGNIDLREISVQSAQNFKAAFESFMKEESGICVFSRLHPFLYQTALLETLGGIRENGSTLYMDLTLPLKDQQAKYHKVLQKQIRQLRRRGYLIKESASEQELRTFTRIYYENMDRLHAAAAYYFEEEYFEGLLQNQDNKLLLIYDGTALICGALVLTSKNIIRNHLSATASDYVKDSPSKLLTDEISLMGRALGLNIFHLGGGVGGKNDSLFMFKRHFSDLCTDDNIWCYTYDTAIYQEIVNSYGDDIDPDSAFFPVYRQQRKN